MKTGTLVRFKADGETGLVEATRKVWVAQHVLMPGRRVKVRWLRDGSSGWTWSQYLEEVIWRK